MASISKISTQIVADARQFNSTIAASEKLATSTFARIAKLQFNPGGDSGRPGPYKVRVDTGDSLKAVTELFARIKARAAAAGASVRGLFGRTPPVPYAPVQGAVAANALAVYKSLGSAAKVVGLTLGHAISHPGIGGAREFRDAWADSFGKVVPSARTAYRALSVLTAPARGAVRAGAGLARGAVATGHEISREVSSFMPSPRTAALGMAAAVGVSAYNIETTAGRVAKAAIETRKFGVSAGVAAFELQAMGFALRYMGEDAAGAVEAYKALEQLQITSRSGGYGATDLMARLGGDAGRVLTTVDNLQDTFNAVNAAITAEGAGMRAVVLASHVYGDNAMRVLRYTLLTRNALADIDAKVAGQGNFIDPKTVVLLQQTDLLVGRIGMAFEGVVARAVAAFAPLALTGLEMLGNALGGLNAEKTMNDLKGFALEVVVFAANVPAYFSMASDYIVVGLGRVGAALDALSARMYRFQADANKFLGADTKSDALNAAADVLEKGLTAATVAGGKPWYVDMADKAKESLDVTRASLTTAGQIQTLIGLRAKLAEAQQVPYDKLEELAGMKRRNQALIDGAVQTARDVEQPFEKLQARLSQLDLMRGLKGNMTDGTYGRAVLKAFTEVESALGTTDIRLPTMGQRDSSEAVSAINRSEVEYRLKVADTPAVRQQRVLDQSLEVLQQIKAYAQASAEAAQQRKTISLQGK